MPSGITLINIVTHIISCVATYVHKILNRSYFKYSQLNIISSAINNFTVRHSYEIRTCSLAKKRTKDCEYVQVMIAY